MSLAPLDMARNNGNGVAVFFEATQQHCAAALA